MQKHRFYCDKLVRDGEAALLTAKGISATMRTLTEQEFVPYLKKKLREEALEIAEKSSEDGVLGEVVDLWEAMMTLVKALGVSKEQFQHLVEEKRQRKGTYESRQCACSIEIEDGNTHIQHYRHHPEKYPEIK